MLRHTFLHVPGIGIKTEERLWQEGVLTWEDFFRHPQAASISGPLFSPTCRFLEDSLKNLSDVFFFAKRLPHSEHWRLWPQFSSRTAYLDIETTGLGPAQDHLTVIGIYDGQRVQSFVWGKNLGDFRREITRYDLLVTYNGSQFDLPFLRACFPRLSLPHAHIDLRFFLKGLGYTGGLKRIEERFGLRRPSDLAGLDGYAAVRLWQAYRCGDTSALETLLRYNAEDIINLKTLLQRGCAEKRQAILPNRLIHK